MGGIYEDEYEEDYGYPEQSNKHKRKKSYFSAVKNKVKKIIKIRKEKVRKKKVPTRKKYSKILPKTDIFGGRKPIGLL